MYFFSNRWKRQAARKHGDGRVTLCKTLYETAVKRLQKITN